MKKGIIITIVLLILFGIGIVFGIYAHNKMNDTQDIKMKQTTELANTKNIEVSNEENIVTTSTLDTKISPNCTIIRKQYYKGCDHLKREVIDIPKSLVNKDKEYFEQVYSDWKLEGYSPTEIVVYKEYDGICGEHYILKDHNGVIGIYILDENNEEILKEDTQIQTQYLTEADLLKLEEGIRAIGQAQLNSVLEDFE